MKNKILALLLGLSGLGSILYSVILLDDYPRATYFLVLGFLALFYMEICFRRIKKE